MSTRILYAPEVKERAVRLVLQAEHEHQSRWSTTQPIAAKIGCTPKTLRSWVNRLEIDQGNKSGITTTQTMKIKDLERENCELKRANEILSKAAFCPGGARPQTQVMVILLIRKRNILVSGQSAKYCRLHHKLLPSQATH